MLHGVSRSDASEDEVVWEGVSGSGELVGITKQGRRSGGVAWRAGREPARRGVDPGGAWEGQVVLQTAGNQRR